MNQKMNRSYYKKIQKNEAEVIRTQKDLTNLIKNTQEKVLNFVNITVQQLWKDININDSEKKIIESNIEDPVPLGFPQKLSRAITEDDKITNKVRVIKNFFNLKKFDENPESNDYKNTKSKKAKFFKKNESAKSRENLFKEINSCLESVIKNSNPDWDEKGLQENKEPSLVKLEFNDPYYNLASQLGARYIPYNQSKDPFSYKFVDNDMKGSCFAHVIKWSDDILNNGISLSLPYHDFTAYKIQKKQIQFPAHTDRDFLKEAKFQYQSHLEILQSMDNLLDAISEKNIYMISMRQINSTDNSHATGIRKIPNTNEIEFFDPNFGLFVFSDINKFKSWFTLLFLRNYYNSGGGLVVLYEINQQLSNARPSILPLENKSEAKTKIPHSEEIIPSPLKDKVKSSIDKEISRLNLVYRKTSIAKLKIDALEDLKSRIDKTPIMPLVLIITQWLSASPPDSTQTYRDIIEQRRHAGGSDHSKTYQFIINLTQNYEIDPHQIMKLQDKLIKKIDDIVSRNWTNLMPEISGGVRIDDGRKIPKTIQTISQITEEDEKSDQSIDKLRRIHDICQSKKTGFLSRISVWRSKSTDDFYNILKKLDPEHPGSLAKTYSKLQAFEKSNFPTRKLVNETHIKKIPYRLR